MNREKLLTQRLLANGFSKDGRRLSSRWGGRREGAGAIPIGDGKRMYEFRLPPRTIEALKDLPNASGFIISCLEKQREWKWPYPAERVYGNIGKTVRLHPKLIAKLQALPTNCASAFTNSILEKELKL